MTPVTYCYDAPLPNDFSATIQIVRTARAWADSGREVEVLMGPGASAAGRTLAELGLAPHPKLVFGEAFPPWPRSLRARLFATRLITRLKPLPARGALMTRGESAFGLLPAIRRRSRRAGPFVYEMHRLAWVLAAERSLGRRLEPGEPPPAAVSWMRRLEAQVVALADGIVFLNAEVKDGARADFRYEGPSVVAPSGVEPSRTARPAEPDVDLVFLGKIEVRKGVRLALETLARLPRRRLLIIGGGADAAAARAYSAELGVDDRVEWLGRISHRDVPRALARARIGLCPLPADVDSVSARFTSPLKLLEMMAAGLPVVASDLPSVRAVARRDVDTLLAEANPEALAESVRRLEADPALRARLSVSACERAEAYSWRSRAATIGGFIDELAAGANGVEPGPLDRIDAAQGCRS